MKELTPKKAIAHARLLEDRLDTKWHATMASAAEPRFLEQKDEDKWTRTAGNSADKVNVIAWHRANHRECSITRVQHCRASGNMTIHKHPCSRVSTAAVMCAASRHCHPKAALAAAAAACVSVIFFLKSFSKFSAIIAGGPPSMIFRTLRLRPTLRRLERLRTRDKRT